MSDQNQPPTTAEIVAKLRAVSVPVECLDVLNLTHDAADRLESYDRILNNVDGALHSYVLRNLSRLQIAHLVGHQAVTQVNELERELADNLRKIRQLETEVDALANEREEHARTIGTRRPYSELEKEVQELRKDRERLDKLLRPMHQPCSESVGWDGTQGRVKIVREIYASADGAFSHRTVITTREELDVIFSQQAAYASLRKEAR